MKKVLHFTFRYNHKYMQLTSLSDSFIQCHCCGTMFCLFICIADSIKDFPRNWLNLSILTNTKARTYKINTFIFLIWGGGHIKGESKAAAKAQGLHIYMALNSCRFPRILTDLWGSAKFEGRVCSQFHEGQTLTQNKMIREEICQKMLMEFFHTLGWSYSPDSHYGRACWFAEGWNAAVFCRSMSFATVLFNICSWSNNTTNYVIL